mmetsp:Transcript_81799/g.136743  ORF Transcript_81799/g.136743 Transcript_81799/m.136743 type:complete len:631 (+) Transcript_81799:465-2357(+)
MTFVQDPLQVGVRDTLEALQELVEVLFLLGLFPLPELLVNLLVFLELGLQLPNTILRVRLLELRHHVVQVVLALQHLPVQLLPRRHAGLRLREQHLLERLHLHLVVVELLLEGLHLVVDRQRVHQRMLLRLQMGFLLRLQILPQSLHLQPGVAHLVPLPQVPLQHLLLFLPGLLLKLLPPLLILQRPLAPGLHVRLQLLPAALELLHGPLLVLLLLRSLFLQPLLLGLEPCPFGFDVLQRPLLPLLEHGLILLPLRGSLVMNHLEVLLLLFKVLLPLLQQTVRDLCGVQGRGGRLGRGHGREQTWALLSCGNIRGLGWPVGPLVAADVPRCACAAGLAQSGAQRLVQRDFLRHLEVHELLLHPLHLLLFSALGRILGALLHGALLLLGTPRDQRRILVGRCRCWLRCRRGRSRRLGQVGHLHNDGRLPIDLRCHHVVLVNHVHVVPSVRLLVGLRHRGALQQVLCEAVALGSTWRSRWGGQFSNSFRPLWGFLGLIDLAGVWKRLAQFVVSKVPVEVVVGAAQQIKDFLLLLLREFQHLPCHDSLHHLVVFAADNRNVGLGDAETQAAHHELRHCRPEQRDVDRRDKGGAALGDVIEHRVQYRVHDADVGARCLRRAVLLPLLLLLLLLP